MSPLEVWAAVLGGIAAAMGAGWAFVRGHSHPENPTRHELDALETLIETQYEAILRELGELRELIRSRR